jgi:uncharacterized membrane protein
VPPVAPDLWDRPTRLIALLCLLGLGIAGYLTYVHYAGIEPVCTTGGCEKVQASELAGVPVALLGLLGYAAIAASLFVRGDLGRTATAALALAGFGFSAYLTYLEIYVIDAICQWCLASAVLMTLLAAVAVARMLRD